MLLCSLELRFAASATGGAHLRSLRSVLHKEWFDDELIRHFADRRVHRLTVSTSQAYSFSGSQASIGIMICRLNDPFIQRVLIMHYLDYKSWRAIAREIGYSHAQIFRYRDAGLAELEEILRPFAEET